MEYTSFLDSAHHRLSASVARIEELCRPLTPEQLTKQPEPGVWGVGQILEHLAVSMESYDEVLPHAVQGAPSGGGEVKHTRFGSFIIKACQPGANSPAPKPFHPVQPRYDQSVVDRFVKVHQGVLDLIGQSKGKDLNQGKVPLPLMKVFKMNLGDIFEIAASHANYHLLQIEERLPKATR